MGFKELDQLRAALRPAESPSKPAGLPGILVIDDDPLMRASLDLLLSQSYCVQVAASGPEGVALVRDELSAVILDVKMSGIDGFATYAQIRKLDADLPIIFHSAYQDIKDPYEIINEFRPFGYITKGEDHSMLLRTLAAAVEQRARTSSYRALQSKLSNIQTQMESLKKRLAGK
jgi:DNA-binding NtrC family response regulator